MMMPKHDYSIAQLTRVEAIKLAAEMLRNIFDGHQYDYVTYMTAVIAIEATVSEHQPA
jgi:hypothetical protein